MTSLEKIDYYIDTLIEEIKNLESYKCGKNPTDNDFIRLINKCNKIEKINFLILDYALIEGLNK